MVEPRGITRMLVAHFFRRFFDNDTIQVEGDTLTTVVRAASIVAVPGLIVSFFLQNQYRQSSPWDAIEDRYFFILLSFVVMGVVSIFEWEMLFPDRLDFLVLSPLSLKPMQMLVAKITALIGFLAIFLVSCNLFATLLLPAISGYRFYWSVYAHAVSVLLAGVFASSFFLALGGVLLCVLDAPRFRVVSPIMQMFSVMVLVLLSLHYVRYSDSIETLLSGQLGMARWIPPLWFLGFYEHLLHGNAAPAFAQEMAGYAIRGTAIVIGIALLTYPMAWARMRTIAIEGGSNKRLQPPRWLGRLMQGVLQHPGERAVFYFIGQTLARNNRYQVYLALYCGSGLAIALACAVTLNMHPGRIQFAFSDTGLHAILPMLLFWVVAGLRTAFAFPLNLSAGWVFRVTGVQIRECATAARSWVMLCALYVLCGVLAALRETGWDGRYLLIQTIFGLSLCTLLTDFFFFSQQSVPFNRPRMPGRVSFPLMLTLYVGVFPLFILWVIHMETQMERHLAKLLFLGATATVIHILLRGLQKRSEGVEEEMEGYDGDFQLLGLAER